MPNVISGNLQVVLGQLRGADPESRVEADILHEFHGGPKGLVTLLTFKEMCTKGMLLRRPALERRIADADNPPIYLHGKVKALVEVLTWLEERTTSKVVSGTPAEVIHRLRGVDPDHTIRVELALQRVSGAEGATARYSFIEACKEAGLWRGRRDAPSQSGGVVALLVGRKPDMVKPIVTLEGRERALG
jgi:hypothetical protein